MAGRYALYYVPGADSEIYALGAGLLGRCVYSGRRLARPALAGVSEEEIVRHTLKASVYGFHGTIVAPFESPASERELAAAAETAARSFRPVPLGRIRLAAVNGSFAALRPEAAPEALSRLEDQCVRVFSRFRRPLKKSDLDRRGPLPPRLRANLIRWGYHLVLDDFQFHLTVADSLPEAPGVFLKALESYLAPALERPLSIDRLALLHQPSGGRPFLCRRIFSLQDDENEQ
ncbi:MAG: DUF1045 domain-containing protein [Candidatus Adiutrix sp.]|jgi:hypothetical protein|nr:DUF1045 domain-containing protein [Candidatus Adiutrix sp.]